MSTIRITRTVFAEGFPLRPGLYERAEVERREDGTPAYYTLAGDVRIPATHAIELTHDDRHRRYVGRAPMLAKRVIVSNMIEWGPR